MTLKRRTLMATALSFLTVPAHSATRLKVVATFSILGDLVRQLSGDDGVELSTLVGPDTDSHSFQPTPADARTLARADVLVSNGLGLEGWLDRLAEAAEFKGRTIVASRGLGVGNDPHCWQDVGNARRYAATIAAGFGTPRDRAALYDRRLADLDSWVRGEIARVPEGKRRVITNHDSFGYFARAYGVVFNPVRGATTDSEPSARDIARLVREARAENIKALFIENLGNPALVAEIAHDSGAELGPRLYTDALSNADGPAPTYEAMMRYNVDALVAGMLKN